MTSSSERFGEWFEAFAREHYQRSASRAKAKLRAIRAVAPDEYLSDRTPPLPRPRFQVWVTSAPLVDWETTSSGGMKPVGRRSHRRTDRKSSGRSPHGWDVFLAPKVMRLTREGVSKKEAMSRVAFALGWHVGKGRPVRHITQKNALERVYRSLDRYEAYSLEDG